MSPTIKFTECNHAVSPDRIPKPYRPAPASLTTIPGICMDCDFLRRRARESEILIFFAQKVTDQLHRLETDKGLEDDPDLVNKVRMEAAGWIDDRDSAQDRLWGDWEEKWDGRVTFNRGRDAGTGRVKDGKASVSVQVM